MTRDFFAVFDIKQSFFLDVENLDSEFKKIRIASALKKFDDNDAAIFGEAHSVLTDPILRGLHILELISKKTVNNLPISFLEKFLCEEMREKSFMLSIESDFNNEILAAAKSYSQSQIDAFAESITKLSYCRRALILGGLWAKNKKEANTSIWLFGAQNYANDLL